MTQQILPASSASHLTRLQLQLRDADHFDKTEVYTADGKDDVTVLNFVRVSQATRRQENGCLTATQSTLAEGAAKEWKSEGHRGGLAQ